MSAFAAVAIDVENIDDHRQREFAVGSGVSLDWTNERTERFLQEHLNSLRDVVSEADANDPDRTKSSDRNFTSSKTSLLKVTRKATTLLTLPDVWRRKESQTFSLIPCCSRRRTNFGSNRRFAERNR